MAAKCASAGYKWKEFGTFQTNHGLKTMVSCSRAEEGHSTYSKPRVNDLSYTAESSSCLYRIMSSSRPKSTLADG
eukprot:scaffold40571_cov178-Skeletonema_dohrnii-CCMP3373.AAC.1